MSSEYPNAYEASVENKVADLESTVSRLEDRISEALELIRQYNDTREPGYLNDATATLRSAFDE